MKSFFDFLLTFNSESPLPYRVLEPELMVQKNARRNWRAFISHSLSGAELAPHLTNLQERGPWELYLLGELFTYKNHKGRSDALFSQFSTDLLEGRVAPETLNGHFLIFGWNQHENEWHVWTNRLGTLHVYYGTDGKRAAVGTFSPAVAVAASKRRLDWAGLSGFFAFGFFPQDRTYYDDVRILRPSTHYVLDENGQIIRQERYWHWAYQPDARRSFDEAVDEFGEVLTDILRDQTRTGRVAIPISSGLDSRTAAAVITSGQREDPHGGGILKNGGPAGRPHLWSYSYGYTDYSSETKLASRIAATRELEFTRFTIPAYLFDHLDVIMASVEGFQGVASTRQAAISDEVGSRADYLIAAHWGDVWMDDMGLLGQDRLDDQAVLSHTLHKIESRGRHWLLENLCRPRLGKQEPAGLLRDVVAQELRRVEHIEEADFRVKAFKTEQWSFRWTAASLRMFQPGAFPRLPFYDNRMVDFCCTIPSNFVGGRRLQIEFLKRHHSDVARVPWDVTGNSLFYHPRFKAVELSRRAWRKMWRIAARRPHVGRNWEVQFLNGTGKAGLREWLLRPGLKLHELVSPAAITNLLDGLFGAPDAANGYTVSSLLTFSAWLEQYG